MSSVSLRGVAKRYDEKEVIHGVDLEVHDGEFMVFVGPSGCGKSTILRMIAGLEEITAGDLFINGQRCNDVLPSRRGAAMVFQSYALYPHMTVAENMGFSLRMAGVPRSERERQVQRAAETLRITDLLRRKPSELSGGQRQRVAIGRAIVRKPSVFLFDEPLSNLDAGLRVTMRIELARLHREMGSTMIYVTHDQVEAMTLGDRIAVFRDGRIEQVGTPLTLYREPANEFVAGFLGSPMINLVARPDASASAALRALWSALGGDASAATARIGIRAEFLQVRAGEGPVPAEIAFTEHLGDSLILHLSVQGLDGYLRAKVSAVDTAFEKGRRVQVTPDAGHAMAFDAQGRRIP